MGTKIRLIQPGLLTTVQDFGRPGRLGMALSRGGGLDRNALSLANTLVGNPQNSAVLEITGSGPTIAFTKPCAIAWTGAPFQAELLVSGKSVGVLKSHRPIIVPANSSVRWTNPVRGFRAWIAFAGGLSEPESLQSRSSHLAAELGRKRLKKNDELTLGDLSDTVTHWITQGLLKDAQSTHPNDSLIGSFLLPRWSIPEQLPGNAEAIELYAFEGRHYPLLGRDQKQQLWTTVYRVSPNSNRQGLRLEGPSLAIAGLGSLPSEPVRFGTVQLPAEGVPYVLLSEHQTTGGYPRVLEICASMSQALAQAGPGVRVRFKPTRLSESQERLRKMRQELDALTSAIDARLRS